jgi:hypothetical protein
MILVEDNRSYEIRRFDEYRRLQEEAMKKRAAQIDSEKQHVMDIVQEADGPIKIVDVANRFGHEAGHYWDSRAAKAKLRLRAFRTIALCVKESFIARHRRKWVVYLGPTNPKRQAWLQKIEETVKSFPHPNI